MVFKPPQVHSCGILACRGFSFHCIHSTYFNFSITSRKHIISLITSVLILHNLKMIEIKKYLLIQTSRTSVGLLEIILLSFAIRSQGSSWTLMVNKTSYEVHRNLGLILHGFSQRRCRPPPTYIHEEEG